MLAVQQLQTLAGVAKGLTRVNETFDLDDMPKENPLMETARQQPQVLRLREQIVEAIRTTLDLWSTDAYISDVCQPVVLALTIDIVFRRQSASCSNRSPHYPRTQRSFPCHPHPCLNVYAEQRNAS
jgi:hypothetical protein